MVRVSILLSVLCFAVGAFGDQVVINEMIDQLLDSVRLALQQKGTNVIQIKDVEKTFNTKIFGIAVPGHFHASGGHAEDLATLHRTQDVVLATEGNTMKLSFGMGFGNLNLGFSQYDFEYLTVKSSGSMDIGTQGSAVHAALSVTKEGNKCIVGVDSVGVDSLGKLSIKMTGKAVLNQLITMLSNWIIENFQQNVVGIMNAKIIEATQAGVTKIDLCSKLPF